jgi:hypothetical protein
LEKNAVQIDSGEAYLLEIGADILIFAAGHGTLHKQHPYNTQAESLAEAISHFSYTEELIVPETYRWRDKKGAPLGVPPLPATAGHTNHAVYLPLFSVNSG